MFSTTRAIIERSMPLPLTATCQDKDSTVFNAWRWMELNATFTGQITQSMGYCEHPIILPIHNKGLMRFPQSPSVEAKGQGHGIARVSASNCSSDLLSASKIMFKFIHRNDHVFIIFTGQYFVFVWCLYNPAYPVCVTIMHTKIHHDYVCTIERCILFLSLIIIYWKVFTT